MDVELGIPVFRVYRMMVQQQMQCGSHSEEEDGLDIQTMVRHMMYITGETEMEHMMCIFPK